MYLEGQQRWPRVHLAYGAFESHCHRIFASDDGPDVTREGSDLYLCCACAAGNAEALRVLEGDGLSLAVSAISRIEREHDFVQETLQEVREKLLVGPSAKVLDYTGRGPLLAWLRVVATRCALDHYRSMRASAARKTELSDSLTERGISIESSLARLRYGSSFQSALRRAVTNLPAQDRNVLRMHVNGQCSIDEIGRAYNVHRATAARWLERARARIYEAVRRELGDGRDHFSESEFRSLARAVGSQLELSFSASSSCISETLPRSLSVEAEVGR